VRLDSLLSATTFEKPRKQIWIRTRSTIIWTTNILTLTNILTTTASTRLLNTTHWLTFAIAWLLGSTSSEGLPPLPGVVESAAGYESRSLEARNAPPTELFEANPAAGPSSLPHTITTGATLQMPPLGPREPFEANPTAGPSSLPRIKDYHTIGAGTALQMPLLSPREPFEANPTAGRSSLPQNPHTVVTGTAPQIPFFSPRPFVMDFRAGRTDAPPPKRRKKTDASKKTQASKRRTSARDPQASVEELPDWALQQAWGSAIGWARVFHRMSEWMVRDLPLRPFWMNAAELEEAVRTALSSFSTEFAMMSPEGEFVCISF
jgi:hypothetical protein